MMQNATQFQQFIQDLQQQNKISIATQLLQLKAEREIAGEDGDKREEQLEELIQKIAELKSAITGINFGVDISPLVTIGENQTILLNELSKEASLLRKLTEGSVEYDKEAAQYRNLSGREVESQVSGKTVSKGGFIDFETARDPLSGQSKRATEANKITLKSVDFTPNIRPAKTSTPVLPKATSSPTVKQPESTPQVDNRGFFQTLAAEISATPQRVLDYLLDFKPTDAKVKDRESKVSSTRQVNPEADNIQSSEEVMADASKADLVVSKQLLDTTREQLNILKQIRDSIAPKVPPELQETSTTKITSKQTEPAVEETTSRPGVSLDIDIDRNKPSSKKTPRGKSKIPSATKGPGTGTKIAKALTGKGGMILGGVLAVGAGAYTAYEGVTGAEASKQEKLENVQARLDSGEITPEQAAAERKEIGNAATIEKRGAIGEGTGMTAGAIAGAKAGAALGTFVGGPIGTAVGGVAGGAIGAFAGSKAGRVVGEYGEKAYDTAKEYGGKAADVIAEQSGKAYDAAKEYGGRAVEAAKNVKERAFSALGNFFTGPSAKNTVSTTPQVARIIPSTQTQNVVPGSIKQTGITMAKESVENNELMRNPVSSGGSNSIVSNTISNNNTNTYIPIKATPRPEYTGSALDRYQTRISVF